MNSLLGHLETCDVVGTSLILSVSSLDCWLPAGGHRSLSEQKAVTVTKPLGACCKGGFVTRVARTTLMCLHLAGISSGEVVRYLRGNLVEAVHLAGARSPGRAPRPEGDEGVQ